MTDRQPDKSDAYGLMTIPEVADHCRIDPKTVRRWIRSGDLPAFQLGRQWRISEKDLRSFLRERWTG